MKKYLGKYTAFSRECKEKKEEKKMELVLNEEFYELPEEESYLLVGGEIDPWGVASGVLSVAGGGLAIAAAVADPEPVSKVYAVSSGACWIASGVTGIISACN